MKSKSWANADVQRAEGAARRAFDELGLAHPVEASIEAIAYELKALVRDVPMSGAVGRLVRLGGKAVIAVSTAASFPGRRRWTIAHELGHLALHVDKNHLQLIEDVTLEEHYDQGIEREANAFASEFLMPTKLWRKHVDVKTPDLDIVRGLASDYQVSLQAAAIRFVKLSPERCALVFAKDGRVQWTALGPEFGHWIERDQKLDVYTLAHDYFAKGVTPSRRESVDISAWVSDSRTTEDGEVVEDCVALPSLQATLSLLWLPS